MPSRRAFLRTTGSAVATLTVAGCTAALGDAPDAAQWHASVGDPSETPAPVVAGDVVVAAGTHDGGRRRGRVDAFDVDSGERLWSRDVGRPTALAADDDRAYAAVETDGRRELAALDVSSGEKRWRAPLLSAQSRLAAAGGLVFAADGRVRAFDAEGRVLWSVERRAGMDFGARSPADHALAATAEDVLYGDRTGVVSLASTDGTVQWRWRPGGDGWNTPRLELSAVGERVLVGGEFPQTVTALDSATGSRDWTTSFGADAHVVGFHAHGGGLVVATATPAAGFGTVSVLDDEGNEHQETRFRSALTGAAGASGLLVVGTDEGTVAGLDAGAVRSERWRASFDGRPLVATDGERGFAQTAAGTLWALGSP